MFHVQFKRMCILLVLDGMLCRYLLNPSGLMCHLRQLFIDLFGINHLSIFVSRLLKPSVVVQSCSPTLCNPMDCSTPGLPVPHSLPKFAQVHVHCISDAVQLSHPLTPSSPSAGNVSQHQGLFQWVICLHQMTKILELQLQHQSFQWMFRVDLP